MSMQSEGAPVAEVEEPAEVVEIEDDLVEPASTEDPDLPDPPALAKWPWQASAAAVALSLITLVGFVIVGWVYVVSHGETAEKQDYEQLLALLDRIESAALLVLGAILGVATTGGVARGAAAVAQQNKSTAEQQHQRAKENASAARDNASTARRNARTANVNREVAQHNGARARDTADDVRRATRALAELTTLHRDDPQRRLLTSLSELPTLTVDQRTAPVLDGLLDGGLPGIDAVEGEAVVVVPQRRLATHGEPPADADRGSSLREAEALAAELASKYGT